MQWNITRPLKRTKSSLLQQQWMDLESAILSKVREGQISCAIPYMWTLKNDTNRLIHKTETEAQRTDAQRTNLQMASGERAGLGVWD